MEAQLKSLRKQHSRCSPGFVPIMSFVARKKSVIVYADLSPVALPTVLTTSDQYRKKSCAIPILDVGCLVVQLPQPSPSSLVDVACSHA